MRSNFSESSRLLVENWEIVKEIREAEGMLAGEVRDFLFSIEGALGEYPWWDNQWVFVRYQDSQVFIAREEWRLGEDEYAFWIGVERFAPESLFGTDPAAQLYMWVSSNAADLVSPLRRVLTERDDLVGEVGTKSNRYVVAMPLRKCLPDELDAFDDIYGETILRFFDCYGARHTAFTEVLVATTPRT